MRISQRRGYSTGAGPAHRCSVLGHFLPEKSGCRVGRDGGREAFTHKAMTQVQFQPCAFLEAHSACIPLVTGNSLLPKAAHFILDMGLTNYCGSRAKSSLLSVCSYK